MRPIHQRILAIIGLVLICASLVLMIAGLFAGDAKTPMLNIALFCFLGAVALLLMLRLEQKNEDDKQE
ncbi:MAG: hypothetical protein ACI4ME_07575 [Aristaeellaceae bacterium]